MNGKNMKHFQVETCEWEEIKPVWEKYLWPNKSSEVKPVNDRVWREFDQRLYNDKEINKFANPVYFCLKDENRIIGTNSIYESCLTGLYFRSRGLWVDEEYRNKGLSFILLEKTISYAKKNHAIYLWTCPRKNALPAYEKTGFIKVSEWFESEFGENCVAVLRL